MCGDPGTVHWACTVVAPITVCHCKNTLTITTSLRPPTLSACTMAYFGQESLDEIPTQAGSTLLRSSLSQDFVV